MGTVPKTRFNRPLEHRDQRLLNEPVRILRRRHGPLLISALYAEGPERHGNELWLRQAISSLFDQGEPVVLNPALRLFALESLPRAHKLLKRQHTRRSWQFTFLLDDLRVKCNLIAQSCVANRQAVRTTEGCMWFQPDRSGLRG